MKQPISSAPYYPYWNDLYYVKYINTLLTIEGI